MRRLFYVGEKLREFDAKRVRHPSPDLPGTPRLLLGPLAAVAGGALRRIGHRLESWATTPSLQDRDTVSHQKRGILELAAQGQTRMESAMRLYLSDEAVRDDITIILGKLQARNRLQAVEEPPAVVAP